MDVWVVLEDENLNRIKAYDPAEIIKASMGPYADLAIRNVIIAYATEEDKQHITRILRTGQADFSEVGRFLSRGFAYRPDKGDKDGPYEIVPRQR
jgi:hypothetical protein